MSDTNWTDEKNQRRCDLIDKSDTLGLSEAEQTELELLQNEMLEMRRRIAPLTSNSMESAILRQAARLCQRLPLEKSANVSEWLFGAADFWDGNVTYMQVVNCTCESDQYCDSTCPVHGLEQDPDWKP